MHVSDCATPDDLEQLNKAFELRQTALILDSIRRKILGWPESYVVFDVETSGFSADKDVIVEFGYCVVRDRKPVVRQSYLLNWYEKDVPPASYLDTQLDRLAKTMRDEGKSWRITPQKLKEEGKDPHKVLAFAKKLLESANASGMPIVAHNGLMFDLRMMRVACQDFLESELNIEEDNIIDTGAIEKASQCVGDVSMMPLQTDSPSQFFRRVQSRRKTGLHWSLDRHCVPKYDFVRRFRLDPKNAHSAGYDAYVTHLLMEEFRRILETGMSQEPLLLPDDMPADQPAAPVTPAPPTKPVRPAARLAPKPAAARPAVQPAKLVVPPPAPVSVLPRRRRQAVR